MEICCLLFESAKDAFGESYFRVGGAGGGVRQRGRAAQAQPPGLQVRPPLIGVRRPTPPSLGVVPAPHADQVRDLLQQFVNIRRHKIEEGLKMVAQASTIKLTNLSAYEANLIRLNLQGSLNMFLKFSKVGFICVLGGGGACACAHVCVLLVFARACMLCCALPLPGCAARGATAPLPTVRQVEMMLEDRAASMTMATPGF